MEQPSQICSYRADGGCLDNVAAPANVALLVQRVLERDDSRGWEGLQLAMLWHDGVGDHVADLVVRVGLTTLVVIMIS